MSHLPVLACSLPTPSLFRTTWLLPLSPFFTAWFQVTTCWQVHLSHGAVRTVSFFAFFLIAPTLLPLPPPHGALKMILCPVIFPYPACSSAVIASLLLFVFLSKRHAPFPPAAWSRSSWTSVPGSLPSQGSLLRNSRYVTCPTLARNIGPLYPFPSASGAIAPLGSTSFYWRMMNFGTAIVICLSAPGLVKIC